MTGYGRSSSLRPATTAGPGGWHARASPSSGETLRFRLPADDAPAFLSEAGWTVDTLLTGSDLDEEHLSATVLAGTLDTSSFVVVAHPTDRSVNQASPGGSARPS